MDRKIGTLTRNINLFNLFFEVSIKENFESKIYLLKVKFVKIFSAQNAFFLQLFRQDFLPCPQLLRLHEDEVSLAPGGSQTLPARALHRGLARNPLSGPSLPPDFNEMRALTNILQWEVNIPDGVCHLPAAACHLLPHPSHQLPPPVLR